MKPFLKGFSILFSEYMDIKTSPIPKREKRKSFGKIKGIEKRMPPHKASSNFFSKKLFNKHFISYQLHFLLYYMLI